MARLMQPIPMVFITTPALACRGRNRGGGSSYYDFMGFQGLLSSPNKRWTHHVGHFKQTIGEDNGVGGRGHRQHEGEGGAESAGDHHIQRVQAYRLGLGQDRHRKTAFLQ